MKPTLRAIKPRKMISTPYPEDPRLWVCACGNEPCLYGFYPVNRYGEDLLCEDGVAKDDGPYWKCDSPGCGRIYTPAGNECELRRSS